MGSDYPFPLGEKPGELIVNNPNISADSRARLLAENTLEFLGLDAKDYR